MLDQNKSRKDCALLKDKPRIGQAPVRTTTMESNSSSSLPRIWVERRGELEEVIAETCPVYIYNDELLNDILFAFSCTEGEIIDKVIYPVNINPHPRIIEKVSRLGLGFECLHKQELEQLVGTRLDLDPEHLIYAPSHFDAGEISRVFKHGAHVAIKDLLPLRAFPDVFRGREIILSGGITKGNRECFPFTDSPSSKKGEDSIDLESYRELLDSFGSFVRGLYIDLGKYSKENFPEFLSDLDRFLGCFPECSVLVLEGNDPELFHSTSPDGMPPFNTLREWTSALRERLPEIRLWMKTPYQVIAPSGVLFTPVREVSYEKGNRLVSIGTGLDILLESVSKGPSHQVFNFSKLEHTDTQPTLIKGLPPDAEDYPCYMGSLPPTEEGDILAITNTGGRGPNTGLGAEDHEQASGRYLPARRICQVKL